MRRFLLCTFLLIAAPLIWAQPAPTPVSSRVELPAPQRSGGMPLDAALAQRRSVRSFQSTRLTLPQISQLLWAAQGVTDDHGHRTAPSAHAQYFLHLYLAAPDGFFEYLPAAHALQKLSDKDIRSTLSSQETVKAAPAVFLIAGEYDRAAKGMDRETAQAASLPAAITPIYLIPTGHPK